MLKIMVIYMALELEENIGSCASSLHGYIIGMQCFKLLMQFKTYS